MIDYARGLPHDIAYWTLREAGLCAVAINAAGQPVSPSAPDYAGRCTLGFIHPNHPHGDVIEWLRQLTA